MEDKPNASALQARLEEEKSTKAALEQAARDQVTCAMCGQARPKLGPPKRAPPKPRPRPQSAPAPEAPEPPKPAAPAEWSGKTPADFEERIKDKARECEELDRAVREAEAARVEAENAAFETLFGGGHISMNKELAEGSRVARGFALDAVKARRRAAEAEGAVAKALLEVSRQKMRRPTLKEAEARRLGSALNASNKGLSDEQTKHEAVRKESAEKILKAERARSEAMALKLEAAAAGKMKIAVELAKLKKKIEKGGESSAAVSFKLDQVVMDLVRLDYALRDPDVERSACAEQCASIIAVVRGGSLAAGETSSRSLAGKSARKKKVEGGDEGKG